MDAITRRDVISAAGATIAAASGGSALSQTQAQARPPQQLRDPRTKYPKPPFARQEQPWPGLASKMDPRPDHGETTYRGSGRLRGRKALITGGDSGMGRAAAIAFAREGADVAISYYPTEEPDAQQVVALIRDAGRRAVDAARRPSRPGVLQEDGRRRGRWARRPRHPRQQRRAPAGARVDPRHHRRGFRRDDEDQHLRAVLDHQGGAAAYAAGIDDRRHDLGAGLRSLARPLRLRADQGGDDELRQVARQAAGVEGHAGERRGARSDLDAAAGFRRRHQEKVEKFGGQTALGRPGQPAELASIYVQLAAEDASYATGQVYGAEGGNGQP